MKKNNLLNFYLQVSSIYKWRILALFVFPIIWCSAENASPFLIKVIIDELSLNTPAFVSLDKSISHSILYYLSLAILIEISIRICNFIWIKFIPKLRSDFRNVILSSMLDKSTSFYQDHMIGELVTKCKNLSNSFDIILSNLLYGIFPVYISSFIILIFLCYIDPLFSFIFLTWFVGMNLVTLYFARKNMLLADKRSLYENLLFGHYGDLFRNIISLNTFNGSKLDNTITKQLDDGEIKYADELEVLSFKIDSIRGVISILIFFGIIICLFWGWQNGRITLGDFSFVTATCFYIRRSVWIASINLLSLFKEIGIANESFKDLMPFLSKNNQPQVIEKFDNYDIEFEDIYFGYSDKSDLFQNLNLYIPEGQKIAILGSSGSGKTTLMHLIVKLLQQQKGKVKIGNLQYTNYSIKNNIVYLPQNTTLFHRSILDNILYGHPQANLYEVEQAAKAACIHDFILSQEDGYKTLVGENGVKLSGGQCQRILLARALLNKPAILILDESTSGIDSKTEKNILGNILKDQHIKTLIMISHNSKNVDLFDRILSFEDGKIASDLLHGKKK